MSIVSFTLLSSSIIEGHFIPLLDFQTISHNEMRMRKGKLIVRRHADMMDKMER
jgi:hypothetical protein